MASTNIGNLKSFKSMDIPKTSKLEVFESDNIYCVTDNALSRPESGDDTTLIEAWWNSMSVPVVVVGICARKHWDMWEEPGTSG